MRRSVTSLLLLCLAISTTALQSEDSAKHDRYIIRLRLMEQVPGETPEKTTKRSLCEPTIATTNGLPAEIRIGGRTKVGKEEIEWGTLAKVQIDSRSDDKLDVTGKIDVSSVAIPSPDCAIRESLMVCFSRAIEVKKTEQIVLNDSLGLRQWCEITIEPYKDSR